MRIQQERGSPENPAGTTTVAASCSAVTMTRSLGDGCCEAVLLRRDNVDATREGLLTEPSTGRADGGSFAAGTAAAPATASAEEASLPAATAATAAATSSSIAASASFFPPAAAPAAAEAEAPAAEPRAGSFHESDGALRRP